ncbi:MAG: two-component regulator propeller domain-containing protein [Verrucomicrobiota bacterium]
MISSILHRPVRQWIVAAFFAATAALAGERTSVPEFLLRNWDMDDGLPSTRINAIARTPDGYLWVGTPNGLARFDGARFVVFDAASSPPLKDSYARSLLVRRDESLLIGTFHGTLSQRNGDHFQTLIGPDITQGKPILTLFEDEKTNLWLGMDGAGIICWQSGVAHYFTKTNGLPGLHVEQITAGSSGQIYFFCDGKLCLVESNLCRQVEKPAKVAGSVTAISPAREGGIWVATTATSYNGTRIFLLRDGQWSEPTSDYPWPQDYSRSRSYSILEDRAGRLWCATDGRGVFLRTPGGSWQALDSRFPQSHAQGLCLKESEDGVIWSGTRTTGLQMIRPGPPVTSLHLPAEFEKSVLICVCVRRDGSVWGGTDSAGLFAWQDGEVVHYGLDQGLPQLQVNAILEDHQNILWAATAGGLTRLQGEHFQSTGDSPLMRRTVTALFEDHEKSFWAGTRGGLVKMNSDGNILKVFGRDKGLPDGLVRAIAEDEAGRVLTVISGLGIFRQDGDRFSKFLPQKNVDDYLQNWDAGITAHSLLLAGDGSFWAASAGRGLGHFPAGDFSSWNYENDGLPSSFLFSVLKDGEGNLWCSSENGLFGIPEKNLLNYQRGRNARLIAWRLTPADGLASKACSGFGQNAAANSPDGKLIFTDGPAMAVIDPANTPRDSRIFPPFIESVVADGQHLGINESGQLKIPSGIRSLEIHYTSPNLLSPERLRFRYQLHGLDKDWVVADNRRVAYFNRLPPAHYAFKLAVSGQEEIWQSAASELKIEIIPRFYERRSVQWAGAFSALVFVGITVWQIERASQRRRIERLKLQRAMDAERQRIARDIHDDLGAGLTEIILLSDTLREDIPRESSADETAGKISASARSLTRAMDEVVWAVNPGNDTLESFLNYLNDYSQEYLSRSIVRFRWEVPFELPAMSLSAETRHNLYLACKEAMHNCVKHASATEVRISIHMTPAGFGLCIDDNGRGFDHESNRKRGNGLHNMRQRLESIGGCCEISSTAGRGTQVKLILDAQPPT